MARIYNNYSAGAALWSGIYGCSKQTSSSGYTLGLVFTAINPWHLCYNCNITTLPLGVGFGSGTEIRYESSIIKTSV